ncbi:MAG TPA: DUF3667 domain-containing protein [Duganella sp.]|uniref:DUF3667 domain-containing protein n=1 Tax=Duganella sp. TaxID=1904440 RepID=UPI002ED00B79
MSTAVHSVPDSHAPAGHCANCDAVLTGAFCANCGQEAHLHHASTREFLHEFIGHYVALEGKLWGTLSRLLFRPGALTNEYIRGRRVRFVQPLRIYLTLSLLFFALLKFTGGFEPALEAKPGKAGTEAVATAADADHEQSKTAAETAIAAMEQDLKAGAPEVREEKADNEFGPKEVESLLSGWPRLSHQWHMFDELPQERQQKVFADAFYHYGPYAIFCLMPVFALFLKVLYLGSGRRFGEHVLFALHTNAFAYLIFCVMLLVKISVVNFALWCWLLAYLPWAMRRVYHRGRFGTFWRWIVLMAAYMICVFVAIAISAASGIMTLH